MSLPGLLRGVFAVAAGMILPTKGPGKLPLLPSDIRHWPSIGNTKAPQGRQLNLNGNFFGRRDLGPFGAKLHLSLYEWSGGMVS
ncbi:hypothetical protein N658DRAFT_495759 [Parathielavia hyrcaniae]|uniref:Uncharacterized protein n=1 Tax=Parathielavia hyrcaniae TaxID=113614 RepID=A0AAN6Q3Z5_9PEZI|nr:hypothetical protein N658DRAFT_495759 [Parathielavia hyrcaniae]